MYSKIKHYVRKRKSYKRTTTIHYAAFNIQESHLKVNQMPTNNITRMLAAQKIPYTAFELPSEKLGAIETARLLGVPLEQVFKTIVVKREGKGKPILAVIPGTSEVDLKRLAKVLGEKKLYLPTEREAERITGLQAGGISPLALLNKGFQVILDSRAASYVEVHISGGQRGLNIRLPVDALVKLCNARLEKIISEV
jgi:Cys-tRNA(Pro)/Cys-tRNA(Cys) deacylase